MSLSERTTRACDHNHRQDTDRLLHCRGKLGQRWRGVISVLGEVRIWEHCATHCLKLCSLAAYRAANL